VLEPFYLNLAINLNTCYTPLYKQEPFKYNIALLVSKLIVTASPALLADSCEFLSFTETLSYAKALDGYKPLMRI
jgi:hypothetical protein